MKISFKDAQYCIWLAYTPPGGRVQYKKTCGSCVWCFPDDDYTCEHCGKKVIIK